MKIAIPVDEDKNMVCVTFGRAPYFLIYNTETEKKEILPNTGSQAQGGAGIKTAQLLVDCKTDVLITPRCGMNSADVFKEAGIKIYKSEGVSADSNLAAFKEGKLSLLEKFHSGYHGKR